MKEREGVCSSARTALQSPAQRGLATPDIGGFLQGREWEGRGEGKGGEGVRGNGMGVRGRGGCEGGGVVL